MENKWTKKQQSKATSRGEKEILEKNQKKKSISDLREEERR